MCCGSNHIDSGMNRRSFIGTSAIGMAAAGLTYASPQTSNVTTGWNPDKPMSVTGNKLRVQPVLVYQLYQRKQATSWRPWGGLHTEKDVNDEVTRITGELDSLANTADFPLQILPVVRVKSVEEAKKIRDTGNFDVPIVYAASGWTDMIEGCVSEKTNNIIFLRHRSGPVYLWYEIIHNRFLRTGGKEFELDTYRNPAGMDIHDIVVDDYEELLYKLRVLYGIKNL